MNGNDPIFESSPTPPTHAPHEDTSVMSTKDWLITLLILWIPCVGIIMPFVWAFGSGNINRRNFFRAQLIMWAISAALVLLMWIAIGAIIFAALGDLFWYF